MTKGKALFVEGEIPKIQRICYFLSETSATSLRKTLYTLNILGAFVVVFSIPFVDYLNNYVYLCKIIHKN